MNRLTRLLLLGAAMLIAGCVANSTQQLTRIDEVPMYGGMDRSAHPDLKAGDEKFISDVSREFGSRENAAKAWVNQGFRFYQQDNLGFAMRRFNQAWLLDPENPEVYWGFGSVLHDRGENCESMRFMDMALSRNPPLNQGVYADAGRIVTLCAISDQSLTLEAMAEMLDRSDALFRQSEATEDNNAYTYATWATAYYWRQQYLDAWTMVAKARAEGGGPSEHFMKLLRKQMPDPSEQQILEKVTPLEQ